MKLPLFLFIAIVFGVSNAQNDSSKDLLRQHLKAFYLEKDQFKKNTIADTIINLAKKQKDSTFILAGYHMKAVLDNKMLLAYCDSMIQLSSARPTDVYPATAYNIKGTYYYDVREYKKAFGNWLICKKYLDTLKNDALRLDVDQKFAWLSLRQRHYKKAIKEYRLLYSKAKKMYPKNKRKWLDYISSLAIAYNKTNQLDSASYYNEQGLKISNEVKDPYNIHWYQLNSAITLYHKNKFAEALNELNAVFEYFKAHNLPNFAVCNYYQAQILFTFEDKQKAIDHLIRVDSVFDYNKDLLPVLKNGYVQLIDHFKTKKEHDKQLYYSSQLLALDSILDDNAKYLDTAFLKDIEIPKLQELHRKAIHEKTKLSVTLAWVSVLLFFIVISLYLWFARRKKLVKQKLAVLEETLQKELVIRASMEKAIKSLEINNIHEKSKTKTIDIPVQQEQLILKKLKEFEEQQLFLAQDISSQSLAKTFSTNVRYLSKVINFYFDKKFTHYINDLRIDFIVTNLNQGKLLNLTLKAIAEESGFRSFVSFTKAFESRTGIRPAVYLKAIKNK